LKYTTAHTRTRRRTKDLSCTLNTFDIAASPTHALTLHADECGLWRTGSTGSSLWTAARAVIDFLFFVDDGIAGRKLSGKRVLEVGSGLGAVGMAAAKHDALVVVFDRHSSIIDLILCYIQSTTLTDLGSMLPLLQRNVDANFSEQQQLDQSITVEELKWGHDALGSKQTYDFILGADVAYDDAEFVPLVESLVSHSDANTRIYLGLPARPEGKGFLQIARQYFTTQPVHTLSRSDSSSENKLNVWCLCLIDQYTDKQAGNLTPHFKAMGAAEGSSTSAAKKRRTS
jgi:predicted nicotinamide N-methyase